MLAANGQLFAYGGTNAAPSATGVDTTISSALPALASGWFATPLQLNNARYVMGSATSPAFFYVIGGDTGGGTGSTTCETVTW